MKNVTAKKGSRPPPDANHMGTGNRKFFKNSIKSIGLQACHVIYIVLLSLNAI